MYWPDTTNSGICSSYEINTASAIKGVALTYAECCVLKPSMSTVKLQVNGPLEIFSAVNNQAATHLFDFHSKGQVSQGQAKFQR